jgi:hypothetical protein
VLAWRAGQKPRGTSYLHQRRFPAAWRAQELPDHKRWIKTANEIRKNERLTNVRVPGLNTPLQFVNTALTFVGLGVTAPQMAVPMLVIPLSRSGIFTMYDSDSNSICRRKTSQNSSVLTLIPGLGQRRFVVQAAALCLQRRRTCTLGRGGRISLMY